MTGITARKRRPLFLVPFAALLLAAGDSAGQARYQFLKDAVRFNEINVRRMRGIQPTREEQAIVAAFNARRGALNHEHRKHGPPKDSAGITALNDLGAGMYKAEQGGLYPNGKNTPPPAHLQAGMKLANNIVPLGRDGKPSADGKVVFISIGYSNWTQEFSVFTRDAMADPDRNPKLLVVDCAQSAQTTEMSANPKAEYWNTVAERLETAGITHAQVQVVGFKVATLYPTLPFPKEPKILQDLIVQTLHNLHDKFPNLKITYLTSRIYGGYADIGLNPEPHAFETGFAVKWTIADQIAGKSELNYDPAKGAVRSPWLAWGPYLWADGVRGRSDGTKWLYEELRSDDHTHPSAKGCRKVSAMLLDFVKKDATARVWFLKP